MVNDWLKYAQYRLLPPVCILCQAPARGPLDLCDGCRQDLPWLEQPCQRCALPLTGAEGRVCGRCLRHAPAYDRVICPLLYQTPASHLLHLLKFNHRLPHARVLAALFAEHLRAQGGSDVEAILPVPLHPARIRERGYNQALELARPISARLRLPLLTHACLRVRATNPQMALDAGQRRRNIKGAFQLRQAMGYRRVAIVDDVMTTGNTVQELARVLKRAGVEYVEVWVLARVP